MLLIARRYLFSPKSHSVVNIIAGVSLVSLLLPVAAVILLLSIFNGFGEMIGGVAEANEADITLVARDGRDFAVADLDRAAIEQIEGVEAASYVREQTLLIEYNSKGSVITLRGVEPTFREVVDIEEYLTVGRFEVSLGDLERIVLGNAMASKLGIRSLHEVDIDIYALKAGRLQTLLATGTPTRATARLAGITMLDQESEERYGYVSKRLVDSLAGGAAKASQLSIRIAKGYDRDRVAREIGRRAGEGFAAKSRSELNPAMYEIIKYEKMGILLICSFVMLLASFTLLGAMAMLIIEKREDIETLRALGATRNAIRRIFLIEGALMSGGAIVAGAILGVGVTLIQQYWGVVEMPSASMMVTAYPVKLEVADVALVAIIAGGIACGVTLAVVSAMLSKRLKAY